MKVVERSLISANVAIEVHDALTGELLQFEEEHNLVVLSGRNLIRDVLNGAGGPYVLTHLAVGTGQDEVLWSDTGLGNEVFRDVLTKHTPDSGKLDVQYYLPSSSGNGNDLYEAGLFTSASGGTMFARVKHGKVAKTASITATYSWSININGG